MPPYPVPAAADNVETVESWSGYALNMHSDKSSRLAYPCVDSAGRPLVTFQTGTLRFWFAPAWSSGEADPTSPQALGRFIEAGQWTADASAGWWSLYLNPDRTAIYFSAHANGQGTDFLKAPIDWRAGEWHLVTLTYSPTATALYIDEALVGQGAGISLVPFPLPLGGEAQGEGAAATFTIGSDAQGQNLAQGFFDDFATFDRAHSAADVVRYNRFTHTFGKTTPVDLASTTLETLQVQFDPSETSLVEVGNGGGLLQLNSPEGGGPNSPLNGGNGLWLEIALITNHAVLTLHGTTPTTNYLFLSRANLTTGAWVPEAFVTGADGQNWTQLVLPIDRPTVFFRAGLGEDTDGDGLPDVYESLVTDTDPNNPDTGDTGTSDGYKDNDGDGWTNLDELNNGTSVNSWDAPPAPLLSAILTLSPQGNNVTLSWETSAGTVSGYEIERVDGFGVHSTLQASPGESSLVDDETRDFDDELLGAPSYLNTYKIRTVYVQGTSQWSAPVPVLKPDTAFNGAIVRGPEGAIYLAVSAIPAVVQSVRLVTRDNTASDPFNAPIHVSRCRYRASPMDSSGFRTRNLRTLVGPCSTRIT